MSSFPKEGIVAVYKPVGMTSHDVVGIVRRATGERRVGHAGTLDPLAKGVLVIGIGRAFTRQLSEIVAHEKEYVASVRLGMTSSTGDEEGEKAAHDIPAVPSRDDVLVAVSGFVGEIMQVPPVYSALKIGGKPAYAHARAGHPPIMEARPILIKEIEIVSYAWPDLSLRIVTGPGAYIRSLAHDFGEALHVGGYLAGLERTRVGSYRAGSAIRID